MAKKKKLLSISELDQFHTEGSGYDILRYVALPELFGKDVNTVLYFTGRNLARKLEITNLEDIALAFGKMGWGNLEFVKEEKRTFIFHLMSDSVALRLNSFADVDFRLEAGFLAEAVQNINNTPCECTEKIHKRTLMIEFLVLYDQK